MSFHPFGKLVLAEKLKKEEKKFGTDFYLPEGHEGRFWKIKIIDTGNIVNKDIKPGMICISNPLPIIDQETIVPGHPEWILLNENDILGVITQ